MEPGASPANRDIQRVPYRGTPLRRKGDFNLFFSSLQDSVKFLFGLHAFRSAELLFFQVLMSYLEPRNNACRDPDPCFQISAPPHPAPPADAPPHHKNNSDKAQQKDARLDFAVAVAPHPFTVLDVIQRYCRTARSLQGFKMGGMRLRMCALGVVGRNTSCQLKVSAWTTKATKQGPLRSQTQKVWTSAGAKTSLIKQKQSLSPQLRHRGTPGSVQFPAGAGLHGV